jgi:regulator of cell morphogenesis and NO signaling
MTNLKERTLSSIVTEFHQVVPVFEKYHLDFCCNGKRSFEEACKEKGIDIDKIQLELDSILNSSRENHLSFNDMRADQLISYITIYHHFYVKQSMPQINTHISRVVERHGDKFPFMQEVLQLFNHIAREMTLHMAKEEQILFPKIKEIEALRDSGMPNDTSADFVNTAINNMENEHEEAGSVMEKIRTLTNNYATPAGSCTTFQVTMNELRSFEEDLHKHVHLENNILFPLAIKLIEDSGIADDTASCCRISTPQAE